MLLVSPQIKMGYGLCEVLNLGVLGVASQAVVIRRAKTADDRKCGYEGQYCSDPWREKIPLFWKEEKKKKEEWNFVALQQSWDDWGILESKLEPTIHFLIG